MINVAAQLDAIIEENLPLLQFLKEEEVRYKSSLSRWSKIEILGHLVDSAQNNIRRLLVSQYEHRPKIVYDQDQWVALGGYQDSPLTELIRFWYLINKHMCRILRTMPAAMSERETETGAIHTLKWIAEDYIKHLLHHLHQILDLEPIPYP